ncbi:hypothetical protein HMPREF1215_00816 [Coprococcus sp. HPP0074]|nr:hypothetical protein HMPREF1215_00816 [Coprococcus sp. HPP0074]
MYNKFIDKQKLAEQFVKETGFSPGQIGVGYIDDLIDKQPVAFDMDIVIEQLRLYAALNGKYICGDNSIDETVYIPVNIAIEIVKLCGIRDSYRFLRK